MYLFRYKEKKINLEKSETTYNLKWRKYSIALQPWFRVNVTHTSICEWRLLRRVSRPGDQQLSRWHMVRSVQHSLDLAKKCTFQFWPNESKGTEDSNNGMVPFWLTNSDLATFVAQKRHSNIFKYLIIDCPTCFARNTIIL